MAQAGIHSLIGLAVRKWTPSRTWLMLGIVLGSMLPDADNLAVAVATVMKLPTDALHRTFTHSLFLVATVIIVFFLLGRLVHQPRWTNLGIGLGVGIILHILLDLLIWFNGVSFLWPIPSWISLWDRFTPPVWFDKLNLSAEFLFIAFFFIGLDALARRSKTDPDYLGMLRIWTWVEVVLFVIFTVLVFVMQKGFMTPYGGIYLLSLALAIGVSIRMRSTIEALAA